MFKQIDIPNKIECEIVLAYSSVKIIIAIEVMLKTSLKADFVFINHPPFNNMYML